MTEEEMTGARAQEAADFAVTHYPFTKAQAVREFKRRGYSPAFSIRMANTALGYADGLDRIPPSRWEKVKAYAGSAASSVRRFVDGPKKAASPVKLREKTRLRECIGAACRKKAPVKRAKAKPGRKKR